MLSNYAEEHRYVKLDPVTSVFRVPMQEPLFCLQTCHWFQNASDLKAGRSEVIPAAPAGLSITAEQKFRKRLRE